MSRAKYKGGQIWESPSGLTVWLVFVQGSHWLLTSDPREPGGTVNVSSDRVWLLNTDDLKHRLRGWKCLGQLTDLIQNDIEQREIEASFE